MTTALRVSVVILYAVIWGSGAFAFLSQTCVNSNSIPLAIAPKESAPPLVTHDNDGGVYLESLLRQYKWDHRLISLSHGMLPVWAEVQIEGQVQIGQIFTILDTSQPPKLRVELQSPVNGETTTTTIEIGQLTTVWADREYHPCGNPTETQLIESAPLPPYQVDQVLENLYVSRIPLGRVKGWNKKKIKRFVSKAPPEHQAHVDKVLCQAFKAGPKAVRMVDSKVLAERLWTQETNDTLKSLKLSQRAMAAHYLNKAGTGRFKRFPCMLVWDDLGRAGKNQVLLVNGGWVLVDHSVREVSEARELVRRGTSQGTLADERITHRLEHFAMAGNDNEEHGKLHLDVRECLTALYLPLTPTGAREALVSMGIWSRYETGPRPLPWSREVLVAAKWYQEMAEKRRVQIQDSLNQGRKTIENRNDLTHLSCICVDSARTTFRDDAIGIRLRPGDADSRFELLLHVADVSDIYSPAMVKQSRHLHVLGEAAANRGASRYDLAAGPLHLLPPTALEALSLKTIKPDMTEIGNTTSSNGGKINRCVTLWMYVDEQTGEVLDSGVERSLISCPVALSFRTANMVLGGSRSKQDPQLSNAKNILSRVERALEAWKGRNSASRKRESRLVAREIVSRHMYGTSVTDASDDGRRGFQRTRSHRLVDGCLELCGHTLQGVLQRSKLKVPRLPGAQHRDRVATAPLRRYVDGMAQRQLLAGLCGYGGAPMELPEIVQCSRRAADATREVGQVTSTSVGQKKSSLHQRRAAKSLQSQIAKCSEPISAVSTGKDSQVVLVGVGAVAFCRGIKGTLKPGEMILVKIRHINADSGKISADYIQASSLA